MSRAEASRIADYLTHIVEAIDRINRYVATLDEPGFLGDEKTQDAVIRNIEIIGEAARNLERYHTDYTAMHTDVPWEEMYLMRNRLSHGYFTVDMEIVWKTVQDDLPGLAALIRNLIDATHG